MSETGNFTPAPNVPADGQSKSVRSGPNVADNAYFGPWPGSQNRISTCADSSDEFEESSYKILDDGEIALIGQARRDLEELYHLIPKKARSDRQRLEAWRQRLDAYESLHGDADMDKLQQTIDHHGGHCCAFWTKKFHRPLEQLGIEVRGGTGGSGVHAERPE